MNFKFTLESCLKSAHPQSRQIYKPRRHLSPMLSQKPRGPTKPQILSNEQVTLNMRDFLFFLSLLSLPGLLGVPLPHPPPGFQEPTGPNPSKSLAFPLPSALRVQSLLPAWLPWEVLPVTVDNGGVSRGWRDQRGIFPQRQFSLFRVFNYLTAGCGLWGFRVKRWGRRWSKGARRVGTKQP